MQIQICFYFFLTLSINEKASNTTVQCNENIKNVKKIVPLPTEKKQTRTNVGW